MSFREMHQGIQRILFFSFLSFLVSGQVFCQSENKEEAGDFEFLLGLDEAVNEGLAIKENSRINENRPFRFELSNADRHGEYWGQSLSMDKENLFKPSDQLSLGFYTDSLNSVYSLIGRYSQPFNGRSNSSPWRWNLGFDLGEVHRSAFDWVVPLSAEQRERLANRSQFDFLSNTDVGDFYVATLFDQFEESQFGMVMSLDGVLLENRDRFFQIDFGLKWQRINLSYTLTSKFKVDITDTLCSRFPNACGSTEVCIDDPNPSGSDPDDVTVSRDYCLLNSTTLPGDDHFDFLLPYVSIVGATDVDGQEFYGRASMTHSAANIMGTDDELGVLGRPNADNDFVIIDWFLSWDWCLNCKDAESKASEVSRVNSGMDRHLQMTTQGQSSLGSILPPQMLAPLGGGATVRGYPESQVSADTVVSATMEYHWLLPENEKGIRLEEVFLFADAAYFRIEREGRLPFLSSSYGLTDSSGTLASLGLGLVLALGDSLAVDATVGYPLKEINRLDTISTVQDFTLYGPENSIEAGDVTAHLNFSWIF